jgi:putative peptidoglycan lipid II flippase
MTRTEPDLLRSTATITAWNAVSRVTGFGRVLAVGAALGTTFVGNTYQSSNLVSNLLFELLAAGLLSAPLVPAFVALLDSGDREGAGRVAGTLLSLSLLALGSVVVIGGLAGHSIMRVLTLSVAQPGVRAAEIRLGTFFLWFFLPQVVLYAVGALVSALLNADRRFAAPAFAPVANNIVVTGTMIAFIVTGSGGRPGLSLSGGQKLLLALGTTTGVVAMTLIPVVVAWRAGFALRPRWDVRSPKLREIAGVGAWGGVLLATTQVLIGVTLVLANRVEGGVVAYQIAFTFFLLPVALAAHPIFTALYPRLSAHAHAGRWAEFSDDVGEGVRLTTFTVLPAAALLAALGTPALHLLRLGALDRAGADLVAKTLAAYAIGLGGYAAFMLLARAAVAAGDARLPAVVGAGIAALGTVLMVVGSAVVDGDDKVVALGIAHSIAMTVGAVALFVLLRREVGRPIVVAPTLVRSLATAVLAGAAALVVARALPGSGRLMSAAAVVAGTVVGAVIVIGGQAALRAPELAGIRRSLMGARSEP